jgi:hypothetical protein
MMSFRPQDGGVNEDSIYQVVYHRHGVLIFGIIGVSGRGRGDYMEDDEKSLTSCGMTMLAHRSVLIWKRT